MKYSLEAEQNILGSFLINDSIAYKIRELKENDFYFESHKIILSCMKKIIDSNKPLDLLLLKNELEKIDRLVDIGGVSYITSLTTIVITTSNIDHYIKIIKEKLLKRQISELANELINNSNSDASIDELIVDINDLKALVTTSSSINDNYIDASKIKREKGVHKSIDTGFNKLNNALDGFRYGTLTILTGKPASGKSTIVNQFIAEAILTGEKAFLYSGELPSFMAMDWFRKTVANDYHIKEYQSVYGGTYTDIPDYAVDLIADWIKDKFFLYDEDAISDEVNLLNTIEHLYLKKGVRLFVLDNLMTIKTGNKAEKYDRQEQIVGNLKNLAKKYNLVIILVAHPRKNMGDMKPTMYDVSGASEIVNYADYILSTYRVIDEEEETDDTYLLILKNRITGKQNISFKMNFSERRKRLYTTSEELNRDYKYDVDKQYVQAEIPEDLF